MLVGSVLNKQILYLDFIHYATVRFAFRIWSRKWPVLSVYYKME